MNKYKESALPYNTLTTTESQGESVAAQLVVNFVQ